MRVQDKPNLKKHDDSAWAGQAVRGVVWSYTALVGSRLVAFAGTIVLARMLMPSVFGQFGFALLVIAYMDTLGDLGVGSALIFRQDKAKEAAQVAFRINLLTGAMWWCLLTTLAPLVADFFSDEMVVPLLRALAWVFPITALGNTHDALLRRNLSFKLRLVPDYARSILKAICAVALAWRGWGVWSLVWGQLVGAAGSTLALWILMRWRPALRAPMTLACPMLRYGSHIVSVNVLSAIVHHLDLLIVGRMLGSSALGFYTLASRTPEVCITMLTWAVNRVAFPTYARFQNDPAILRQAFRSTLRYVSVVTLPAGLGLAFTAGLIVPLLFGERWLPATPVLVGLALAAAIRSLGSHAGDIFKAIGRPDILTKLGVLRTAVLLPALVWSSQWGIAGVAGAQAAVTAVSTLATLIITGRILAIPRNAWWNELQPAAVGSAGMILALFVVRLLVEGWPPAETLLTVASAGAASYAAALYLGSPDTVRNITAEVVSVLGRSA